MELTSKILITIITILVILSFFALFHLMMIMRKKIDRKELNYWFIILLGIPVIGTLLYLGFVIKENKLKSP